MMRCDAEGSRNSFRITPISPGLFGRSISMHSQKYGGPYSASPELYEPSISAGLSKSIRRMRPVERARMRTLLATSAATKSDDMANWSETLSMLNMGRDASTS